MINEISRYIPEQLLNFITSQKCCHQFCGSFRSSERVIFSEFATEAGLKVRNFVKNGVEAVFVHKKNCSHFIQAEFLQIQAKSAKELFTLLHNLRDTQSMDFPNSKIKPTITPCRFSFKQSMAKWSLENAASIKLSETMEPYRQNILLTVARTRVVVINGDARFQKSTAVPMFLLNSYAEKYQHCKIICVELNSLLAIHNCEFLAKNLNEKVGDKIAYQVQGQSVIRETSNIIFTSVSYLLRVFMGQEITSSLPHVSHIIINDVQIRNAYCDLLITELRNVQQCYPELRIVMLSNSRKNSIFLEYFNEGEEIRLGEKLCRATNTGHIFYLEEVQQIVDEKFSREPLSRQTSNVLRDFEFNQKFMDRRLDLYDQTGSDQALNAILYMVCGEFSSLNYRHSITGSTVLSIAAKLGKAEHIRTLLHLHPDPYISNVHNQNALDRAMMSANQECIDLLSVYCGTIGNSAYNSDPAIFDGNLVGELVSIITMHPDWPEGNVLIFVPCFEQLVRVNFALLRLKLIGKLPQKAIIRILHDDTEKEEINEIFELPANTITIIISTDIGEVFPFPIPIKYIVDCARTGSLIYDSSSNCVEQKFRWNSQESIENRSSISYKVNDSSGVCFRLIPHCLYTKLPVMNAAELLTVPLDRICLAVKLLSPHTMVAEYLQRSISRPPFIHVYHAVEYLKKIEVFDYFEDITWLGCRLIDLPVDCHLGKLLIFGVLCFCYDPILTIVSFLSQNDPLKLPKGNEKLNDSNGNSYRFKMKEERKRLAQNNFSDHLIYLRLFQEWQNEIPDGTIHTLLVDEREFVMKSMIEKIALMRTKIVGAMRSAQLIHNQGQLSMHTLNLNSSNWSMIKAAMVGGLYPKICAIDSSVYRIKSKSGSSKELVIHPISVLRNLSFEPLSISVQKFPSPWMVYSSEINAITCNAIENCTLINPLAVIMFAGPSKIHNENLVTFKAGEQFSKEVQLDGVAADSDLCNIYIDDWIWFTMNTTEAQLILKVRKLFYNLYINYLRNCTMLEKNRNQNYFLSHQTELLECLTKLFTQEDNGHGFLQPHNVGDRPKAKSVKFLQTHNNIIGGCQNLPQISLLPKLMEKQYFVVYHPEFQSDVYTTSLQDPMYKTVSKIVAPYLSPDKLTFVISYKMEPDCFCSIYKAFLVSEEFQLQECFRNNIPTFEIIDICFKRNIRFPTLIKKRITFKIDSQIGDIILDLFAYRDNWFHNY